MFLLKKIKQIINKSISTNKNNSNDKDNFQENDLLNITFEENIVKIEIKEECTLKEYSDNIDEFDDKIKNLDIPIGILIFFDEHNISKSKLKQQTIFIFSNNSINYIITISNNITKISERRNENNEINETVFEPKFDEKEYKILKYIHDLNRSTKVVKWYPENNSNYKYFTLDKKEALSLAQNLLDNLETIKNMDNILRYPHYIYNLLNLISNKHYNPVISDEVLTLSCPCGSCKKYKQCCGK